MRLFGPLVLLTILQGILLLKASRYDQRASKEAASFLAPAKATFTDTTGAKGSTTAHIEGPSDSSRLEEANTPNDISLSQHENSPLRRRKMSEVSVLASVEDEYSKALFWLFPGSGEHSLECILDPSASGLLLRDLAGSSRSNIEEMNNKDVMLGSIPKKRVILVRHPFDTIWERYEHAQTASLTRHIQKRDFHSRHFELQALAWAKEYHYGRFPSFEIIKDLLYKPKGYKSF